MDSEIIGRYGEMIAAKYLIEHGYVIYTANYSSKFGEIDIVAEDRKYISFVEVKTRSDGMRYSPSDAVDFKKRKKIIATSKILLKNYDAERQPRFDIIEVYFKDDKPYKINHIKNAFDSNAL